MESACTSLKHFFIVVYSNRIYKWREDYFILVLIYLFTHATMEVSLWTTSQPERFNKRSVSPRGIPGRNYISFTKLSSHNVKKFNDGS